MVKEKKAWVVAVDMGYGHQRAAYPLKDIAYERIFSANSDKIINKKEKKLWKRTQSFYEWVSRAHDIPIVGEFIFRLYDEFQSISPFYPFRDLSKPTMPVFLIEKYIKKGLGKCLIDHTKTKKLPFITTFFIPALAADYWGLKDIFCIVTDTDINRGWIAKNPKTSKINYLAPLEHTAKRLEQYGVPKDRIFLTGFPLPKENLGGVNLKILKKDLGNRLPNLDPKKIYINKYKELIRKKLGKGNFKNKSNHILTLTFVVGGAGAQKEIGMTIIKSFKKLIQKNKIRINLVAGVRLDVVEYFRNAVKELDLEDKLDKNIMIIDGLNKGEYFSKFNEILHETDILWTKPSELSFYTALGIPIIISPPIGAHEFYNKKWLMQLGTGFPQEDPEYTNEWLLDLLESGALAEGAFEGFMEAPNLGIYNIEKLIFKRRI
jgi:hypothetical protein